MDHVPISPVDSDFYKKEFVCLTGVFDNPDLEIYQAAFETVLSLVRDSPYSLMMTNFNKIVENCHLTLYADDSFFAVSHSTILCGESRNEIIKELSHKAEDHSF